ncbi:MAG: DUF4426 domain-containing protein [Pseudomonadota bacterium]
MAALGETMMQRHIQITALACAALLAGCGGSPNERTVPQAQTAPENSAMFGDFTVHFHSVTTDEVPADVARSVGIVRARNRAMLNVSVQETDSRQAVEADVQVKAVNLTGQLKKMTMRKVEQGDAIYYLGELSVANRETIIFDISVTPSGSEDAYQVRTQRIYYTD